MKILLILSLIYLNNLLAIDATMEIIKESKNLPNVQINVTSSHEKSISNKIKKILNQDLLVSGHFVPLDLKYENSFNSQPNYVTLKKNDVDLFSNILIKKNGVSITGEI